MPAPPLGSDPAIDKATRMSALETLIRDLKRRRGRERRGLALAEGVRLVEEALAARVPVRGAVVSPALEATRRGEALERALVAAGVKVEHVDDRALAGLADTEHPQGIVAVVEPRDWSLDDIVLGPRAAVLVLDAVQDPGNVGTMLRTALALGAAGVVALPGTADLRNPKVIRGSMGACFRLPGVATDAEALAAWAGAQRAEVWITDAAAGAVPRAPRTAAILLVVGNEGAGVGELMAARASHRVGIPLAPGAESLNVAVAAGILLYEVLRAD
ncbi:MAG: tRNA/rRNA methyltransferase (SpoU) [Gemmatimonadetes bacterium]|nr:tRNA/rRNA methyltransferase (SpoU) [Gemmatimonadota bacterium]